MLTFQTYVDTVCSGISTLSGFREESWVYELVELLTQSLHKDLHWEQCIYCSLQTLHYTKEWHLDTLAKLETSFLTRQFLT